MNRCEMILMALWMVVNHLELKVYITADMLKEGGEMTIEAYIRLCNEVWKPGTCPSASCQSVV